MERRTKIYEGKAKILYETDNPDLVIQYFKDEATAFDAKKRGIIEQKGVYNNRISSVLFEYLKRQGVRTLFVRQLSDREMLVKRLESIKVEVVVRNMSAGRQYKSKSNRQVRVSPEYSGKGGNSSRLPGSY